MLVNNRELNCSAMRVGLVGEVAYKLSAIIELEFLTVPFRGLQREYELFEFCGGLVFVGDGLGDPLS